MTKKELIAALEPFGDYEVVVCANEDGAWDNIIRVQRLNGGEDTPPAIVSGGGSPFSDE
jgi:hypothetical protein